jgi:hypothetical protein
MNEVNNVEDLVAAYLKLRGEKDAMTEIFEQAEAQIKQEMSNLEHKLLGLCATVGADSIKTSAGTVIRTLHERYYTQDWYGFKQFVRETDNLDLFERRINQGNFKEYLKDNPDMGLPPGVNVLREYKATVRKPSK